MNKSGNVESRRDRDNPLFGWVLSLQRAAGNAATSGSIRGQSYAQPVQRVVEVRPPGRREASAFDRRQELIDRLNAQSAAVEYQLNVREIRIRVIDATALTDFDRQMQGFVGRAEVVPMRLITRAGFVDGAPLEVDSLQLGYVDLDDLLAGDDHSFQLNLIHLLTERFRVRNYERRIGTNMDAAFPGAHRAGLEAEAEHLRNVIGDPTIRFNHERRTGDGRLVFVFRSAERYSVVHVFRSAGTGVQGGHVFVITRDNRRLTVEELRTERAARVPAPAPLP